MFVWITKIDVDVYFTFKYMCDVRFEMRIYFTWTRKLMEIMVVYVAIISDVFAHPRKILEYKILQQSTN